jgi:hypothetical protein
VEFFRAALLFDFGQDALLFDRGPGRKNLDIFGYPGAAGMQQDGQIFNQGLEKPAARRRGRAFDDQSQRNVFIGSRNRALLIVVKNR